MSKYLEQFVLEHKLMKKEHVEGNYLTPKIFDERDQFCWNSILNFRPTQSITFEKVRRVTNHSPKMTIWSLASDL